MKKNIKKNQKKVQKIDSKEKSIMNKRMLKEIFSVAYYFLSFVSTFLYLYNSFISSVGNAVTICLLITVQIPIRILVILVLAVAFFFIFKKWKWL